MNVYLLIPLIFIVLVVVDCGSLPDPAHGMKIKETKTTFGGRADFICRKKRYSIVGSRRRFCQANGEWSGKPTLCKGISVHRSFLKGQASFFLRFSAIRWRERGQRGGARRLVGVCHLLRSLRGRHRLLRGKKRLSHKLMQSLFDWVL